MAFRIEQLPRWIVVAAIILSSASRLNAATYHSNDHGFAVTIPDGWKQIPQDDLNRWLAANTNPNDPQRTTYDSAFQPGENPGAISYPCTLVQFLPWSILGGDHRPSEDEFSEVLNAVTPANVGKAMDQGLSPQARASVGGVQIDPPILDKPTRRYRISGTMNIAGVGNVHLDITGYFGRDGVAQVTYYSFVGKPDTHTDAAKAMADSLVFDPDQAYPDPTPPAKSRAVDGGSGSRVPTVLGIAVGIAVVLFLVRKLKAR